MLQRHFSSHVKGDMKLYQAPSRCLAYALQEPFKKELERLEEHLLLVPERVNEVAKWFNSFVIVPNLMAQCTFAWTHKM